MYRLYLSKKEWIYIGRLDEGVFMYTHNLPSSRLLVLASVGAERYKISSYINNYVY